MNILISIKNYFKTKTVTKNKQGHFIVIICSIHQGNIKVINMYFSYTITTTREEKVDRIKEKIENYK